MTENHTSSWPPMPKENNSEKCQSIFWNILYCIEAGAPGEVLIHELAHTVRCDHINDLSIVRTSIEDALSTKTLKDVLSFSHDQKDAKKTDIHVAHFASWTDREVYKGLTFWNKVYYQTYFRWDKWASGVTLFAGTVGGIYKVYKRLAPKIKEEEG